MTKLEQAYLDYKGRLHAMRYDSAIPSIPRNARKLRKFAEERCQEVISLRNMGHYTTFTFRTWLKDTTPKGVYDILDFMCKNIDEQRADPFTEIHPLFKTSRWDFMLKCTDCGPGKYYREFVHPTEDERNAQLSFFCSFKNYNGEVQLFLDFIQPYVVPRRDLFGYWHDENDEVFNFIFYDIEQKEFFFEQLRRDGNDDNSERGFGRGKPCVLKDWLKEIK